MTIRELIAALEEKLQEVGDVRVEMEQHYNENEEIQMVVAVDDYVVICY